MTNWVTLDSAQENNTPSTPTNPSNCVPKQLVEAQGWRINEQGQVILTASSPDVTPHNPWQTQLECLADSNAVQD